MTFSLVLVTRDAGSSSLEEGSKRGQFCSKHRVRAGKTDLSKGVGPPSSQGQHRELTSGPHLDPQPTGSDAARQHLAHLGPTPETHLG